MFEFKKIWTRKTIIVFLLLLICNFLFFYYNQLKGRNVQEFNNEYKTAISVLNECKNTTIEGAENVINEQLELYGRQKLLLNIKEKITYLKEYHNTIETVIQNADRMKRMSLFSDKNSSAYRNIIKTKNDFIPLLDIKLSLDNSFAAEAVILYKELYLFILVMIFFIVYSMTSDRDYKLWRLIYTYGKGRSVAGYKKTAALSASIVIICITFYFESIILSFAIYGGISDILNPIQTLIQFAKYPSLVSKLQYLITNMSVVIITMLFLGFLLRLLFLLFRSKSFSMISAAALSVVELLLYHNIEPQSIYKVFHNVNLVHLLNMPVYDMQYKNIALLGGVLSVKTAALSFITIGLLTLLLIIMLIETFMKPEKQLSFLNKIINTIMRFTQYILAGSGIVVKEIYKVFVVRRGILLLFIAGFASVYFIKNSYIYFDSLQTSIDKFYLTNGGPDTKALKKELDDKIKSAEEIKQYMFEAEMLIKEGKITQNEYIHNLMKYEDLAIQYKKIEELQDKYDYLLRIEDETGIKGYVMPERGYEQIFAIKGFGREEILLMIGIIIVYLLISDSIALEYECNMNKLLKSFKRGHTYFFIKKICVGLIIGIVAGALIFGLDISLLKNQYGFPYLQAPLYSLEFAEGIGFNGSIGEWMILLYSLKLSILFSASSISLYVTLVAPHKTKLFLPFVIGIYYAFISNGYRLNGNNIIYILLIILVFTAILLYLSIRKWNSIKGDVWN